MPAERPKLIFLVTEDWYFCLHRLPMARAAHEAGFDVAVATRVSAHGEAIRAAGFGLHPLRWKRRAFGPLASLAAIVEIWRLYRRERPLVVHHVSLKPALLGGIAARLASVPAVVTVITGWGYIAVTDSLKAKLLHSAIVQLVGRLLLRHGSRVVVENRDDKGLLTRRWPEATARILAFSGTGIDLERFRPAPEPAEPPVVAAYAGRMIATKGVITLVEAQQSLRRQGLPLDLILAGAPDPENPSSIDAATFDAWKALPGVRRLGHQDDVRTVWLAAHIAVLPSLGGEGLPVSLLEAAAMGRAVIATDVSGAREIARPGINAMLVPPGDAHALAEALAVLVHDGALRRRLGEAGRRIVEAEYDVHMIETRTIELYRSLLDEIGASVAPAGTPLRSG